MPLTRALLDPNAKIREYDLYWALYEIIPAGFHCDEGRLTPGSIEFIPHRVSGSQWLTVDVVLDIEAFPYKERENLDERAKNIKTALKGLFPGVTFAVWPKLVNAGWASDSSDPDFDGDMSMPAAIERAKRRLGLA